jgi:hypothetical protein
MGKKHKKDKKHAGGKHQPVVQDKTSFGGDFNQGVTSRDPDEKERIEKKGNFHTRKTEEAGVRGQISSQNEDSIDAAQRRSAKEFPEIANEKSGNQRTPEE